MLTTAINMKILNIMQICDSNFPVGSFNHSFGMETYLRNGDISDSKTLKKWREQYLVHQFMYSDGFAVRLVYEYIENNQYEKIWELDRIITVQTTARETREGAKLVGQRMVKTYLDLYDIPLLKEYEKRIREKKSFGHPAIATAVLMKYFELTVTEAVLCYMYSTVSTLIQNGVRAIPLGQKQGLIIMKDFFPVFEKIGKDIMQLDEKDFGANVPGLEISQINHENLVFRLFMS